MNTIEKYQEELSETIEALYESHIDAVVDVLIKARSAGKKVFIFGNGGSAATAIHFANDLNKLAGAKKRKRAIEAHTLTNTATITALANDIAYNKIFSEQLRMFANPRVGTEPRDIAFGISCSGNSENVMECLFDAIHGFDMVTVLLTGDKPSKGSSIADYTVFVPSSDIRIQEDAHLAICHIIAGELRDRDK